eukprot:m.81672 g.81672  ORF g.81672 m.81672 type:complete len:497 (-) comp12066_c0_seq4:127-1617(-)
MSEEIVPPMTDADASREAKKWITSSGIIQTLEKVVNITVERKPKDTYGFISRRMEMISDPPSLKNITLHKSLSNRFEKTVEMQVVLLDRLLEIPFASVVLNNPVVVDDVEAVELFLKKVINAFEDKPIVSVRDSEELLSALLLSLKEEEGDEKEEGVVWQLWQSLSVAIASSIAQRSHTCLAHALIPLSSHAQSSSLSLSCPLVKIFSPAASNGKLHIRGVYIRCPRQMDPCVQAMNLHKMQSGLHSAIASQKSFVSHAMVDPSMWCFNVPFDKLSQVMDTFRHACDHCGLQCGRDVYIVLDIGADREGLYDPSKRKYEVEGGGIKADDWLRSLKGLCADPKNGVIDVIDPLHPEDEEGWTTFCNNVGEHIHIGTRTDLQKQIRSSSCNNTSVDNEEHNEREDEEVNDDLQDVFTFGCVDVSNDSLLKTSAELIASREKTHSDVVLDAFESNLNTLSAVVDTACACNASLFTTCFPLDKEIVHAFVQMKETCSVLV